MVNALRIMETSFRMMGSRGNMIAKVLTICRPYCKGFICITALNPHNESWREGGTLLLFPCYR